jgi:hypothetical protein
MVDLANAGEPDRSFARLQTLEAVDEISIRLQINEILVYFYLTATECVALSDTAPYNIAILSYLIICAGRG